MKVTSEMPKEGQFVAVWGYNDKLWSDTHRWNSNGRLERFHGGEDWHESPFDADFYDSVQAQYIIKA